MGKIIDSVLKAGKAMLPKFEPTQPAELPPTVAQDPTPEPEPEPEPDYERIATPAQITLAGIVGGMQADEVRERLKRVMAPPCNPPSP